MKLYDCEQEEQEDLVDSGQDIPAFDKGPPSRYFRLEVPII